MIFDRFPSYSPHDFLFKIAKTQEDLDGFFSIRREIFCEEQGIFDKDDRDLFDEKMIPIVPYPMDTTMERWLVSFPSYGYLFAISPDDLDDTLSHFITSKITCQLIGVFTKKTGYHLGRRR